MFNRFFPSRPVPSFEGLERRLNESFSQVEPNPDFVNQLRNRLSYPAEVTLERAYHLPVMATVIIGMSLFSGTLLYWIIRGFRRRIHSV